MIFNLIKITTFHFAQTASNSEDVLYKLQEKDYDEPKLNKKKSRTNSSLICYICIFTLVLRFILVIS